MKTTSPIVLASAAALLALSAPTAAAVKCNYAEVSPQLHSMANELSQCKTATGYGMTPPLDMPTPEQQWALCEKCTAFINKVTPMKWPDCTMMIAKKEQTFTAYFESILSPCK